MLKKLTAIASLFLLVVSLPSLADKSIEKDKIEIKKAVLDYIEGWYEGNMERMEKALHPDLVKRIVVTLPKGGDILDNISANTMIEYTKMGFGKKRAKEGWRNKLEIEILDIYKGVATVKSITPDFIDYIHLAKINHRWVIVNVLWERNK